MVPLTTDISARLRLPLIAAPMFLVSGPQLVTGACANGVIGSFPCANARTPDVLETWIQEIRQELAPPEISGNRVAPWAANIVVHPTNPRMGVEMDILERYQAPLVITALGGPQRIVDRVHSWGGKVLADVNSLEFARKAARAGVDGLILVASGAGGHTGRMNGFAFLTAVRDFFEGFIALGGGLMRGSDIRAVETAGADLAVMGTAFIATSESLADPEYKQMLINSTIDDLVLTNTVTNVLANWLRPTLIRAGIDPQDFLLNPKVDFGDSATLELQKARWKTVWSAGHGLGCISKVEPVSDVIARLASEYRQACKLPAYI
jgi:nitronate monooxygenase